MDVGRFAGLIRTAEHKNKRKEFRQEVFIPVASALNHSRVCHENILVAEDQRANLIRRKASPVEIQTVEKEIENNLKSGGASLAFVNRIGLQYGQSRIFEEPGRFATWNDKKECFIKEIQSYKQAIDHRLFGVFMTRPSEDLSPRVDSKFTDLFTEVFEIRERSREQPWEGFQDSGADVPGSAAKQSDLTNETYENSSEMHKVSSARSREHHSDGTDKNSQQKQYAGIPSDRNSPLAEQPKDTRDCNNLDELFDFTRKMINRSSQPQPQSANDVNQRDNDFLNR